MKYIGIFTAGGGPVPHQIIRSFQKSPIHRVNAIVWSDYHVPLLVKPPRPDLYALVEENGFQVENQLRGYTWKDTSVEAYEKHPAKVRGYVRRVSNTFRKAHVDLVIMHKQDHLMPDGFLNEFRTLSSHPSDPNIHGGRGKHHYKVLEEVLKAGEEKTAVTIMKVESGRGIDRGSVILQEDVEIEPGLREVFKEKSYSSILDLDEIVDKKLEELYPRAINLVG